MLRAQVQSSVFRMMTQSYFYRTRQIICHLSDRLTNWPQSHRASGVRDAVFLLVFRFELLTCLSDLGNQKECVFYAQSGIKYGRLCLFQHRADTQRGKRGGERESIIPTTVKNKTRRITCLVWEVLVKAAEPSFLAFHSHMVGVSNPLIWQIWNLKEIQHGSDKSLFFSHSSGCFLFFLELRINCSSSYRRRIRFPPQT